MLQEEDHPPCVLLVLEHSYFLCNNRFDFALLFPRVLLLPWSIAMDLDLLKCSICPKQPSFSDVSHLLTHVSSKGHLSHLHKLQVRSHQEFEAGILLANYNQWYEQHGLAQLLSERMVTKQVKKAGRRKAAIDQGAYVTETGTRPPAPLDQPPLQPQRSARGRAQGQKKTTRGRRSKQTLEDDSDFEYSPVKRPRSDPSISGLVHKLTIREQVPATTISNSFSRQRITRQ